MVRELIPKLVFGAHYAVDGITSRRSSESYSRQFIYINDLEKMVFSKGEERLPKYKKYGLDFYLNIGF